MSEANETRQKAQAVINAIANANDTAKEQAYD
jgi:anthranilate synthase component 1